MKRTPDGRVEYECGVDFCGECGDCLHCNGGDPCWNYDLNEPGGEHYATDENGIPIREEARS